MAHNLTFESILGIKCAVVNSLTLLHEEMKSNFEKICCVKYWKLIIVNMASKEFNPAHALQLIQKTSGDTCESRRPKIYVIAKDY